MNYAIKSTLCNASYALKLPWHLGFFRKNNIIVLMYHGITSSPSDDPSTYSGEYALSINEFEEQIAYLKEYCNVLSASEAFIKKNVSPEKKNVVITFDDGFRNNFTNAFPVLMKYNMPALFSITTNFVVNRVPMWFDILAYAMKNTQKHQVRLTWNNNNFDFPLVSNQDRSTLLRWLRSRCFEIQQEERDSFISSVVQELDVPIDNERLFEDTEYAPLSANEITSMCSSNLAEFAAHSIHHYLLTHVTSDTLKKEIVDSKSAVEQLTNSPCKFFCIPGGFYNDEVLHTIFDAGFDKIFSSDYLEVVPARMPDVIGRHCIEKPINSGIFADIVHGPFHALYFYLKSKNVL